MNDCHQSWSGQRQKQLIKMKSQLSMFSIVGLVALTLAGSAQVTSASDNFTPLPDKPAARRHISLTQPAQPAPASEAPAAAPTEATAPASSASQAPASADASAAQQPAAAPAADAAPVATPAADAAPANPADNTAAAAPAADAQPV